ncbi:uncharacterized protein DUF2510 [Microcella alkaliphila]|uniref:Uncharacterized protein DUF2510 n=1 Tax=Microcella alkaliphila TaxID=279828 RepID=A0A4Q7TSC4_9MICO|nr:DUF2510 domain-containing protein [Microcella alkaliphila]RZT63931.1 uncharacterized protein DUF2510 [Microcella alkaliphila]
MSDHRPDPGWYDDPHVALSLRWWDGRRWTHHTRPKPVVPYAEIEERFTGMAGRRDGAARDGDPRDNRQTRVPPYTGAPMIAQTINDVAEPSAAAPYPYTAPGSLTPASPLPASVAPHSPPSLTAPSSAAALGSGAAARESRAAEFVPDRAAGFALWSLALAPLLLVLTAPAGQLFPAAVPVGATFALGLALLALWLITWAIRDRAALRAWGHGRRPSPWWLLLGPLGYLAARVTVLRYRRTTSTIALGVCVVAHAVVIAPFVDALASAVAT